MALTSVADDVPMDLYTVFYTFCQGPVRENPSRPPLERTPLNVQV